MSKIKVTSRMLGDAEYPNTKSFIMDTALTFMMLGGLFYLSLRWMAL